MLTWRSKWNNECIRNGNSFGSCALRVKPCVCCKVKFHLIMDPTNQMPANGSTPAMESVSVQQKSCLNVFDLVKVGLSSTFALIVFFGIGYVVKHVAGPSSIISVLIAAFIAYLVGKIEFQCTGQKRRISIVSRVAFRKLLCFNRIFFYFI